MPKDAAPIEDVPLDAKDAKVKPIPVISEGVPVALAQGQRRVVVQVGSLDETEVIDDVRIEYSVDKGKTWLHAYNGNVRPARPRLDPTGPVQPARIDWKCTVSGPDAMVRVIVKHKRALALKVDDVDRKTYSVPVLAVAAQDAVL